MRTKFTPRPTVHPLSQHDLTHADAPRPGSQKMLRSALQPRALEQRFMFDGAAVADASHAAAQAASEAAALKALVDAPSAVEVRAAAPSRDVTRKEAVLVDTTLTDYKVLEQGIDAGKAIIEFNGTQDGLAQIAKWASVQTGYDALHILSHGVQGRVLLGKTDLDATTLASDAVKGELAIIGQAMHTGGDILFYGCDVGAGIEGQRLITTLAEATGTDVAASTDATGAARLGGDWALEAQTGTIDARALSIDSYAQVLAVTSFSSADPDMGYTTTSVTRTSGGQTFTFSGGVGIGGLGIDTTYNGVEAVYAYEGTAGGNDVKLTIAAPNGYTFDLSSFKAGAATGSVSIALTYGNNSTTSFSSSVSTSSLSTLTSFSTAINDVKQVVLTSTNFADFNDFDITDVKLYVPPPTVSDGYISITSSGSGSGGAYKIGDTVTASWNNTAGGQNQSGITGVTMDFSQFGGGSAVTATNSGGTWTASYLIAAGSVDASNRNVSVSASNSGGTTTTADTTNATVDSIAPTVTDAKVSISGASGPGGAFKIGDTVTATWNNTVATGDNNADTISSATVDFSAFGGGSAVSASNSSGTWTATYTITSGAIDATSRNVSVTATDNAGNTTTTADTTNATVDSIAPTITDARISISGASGNGGVYKIGDTVTATWNNTAGGDNNADTISGATVDFSAFGGGSAVSASNSSGTWTATYTIVAGAINNTSNRNVSVTATDNAGNTTTTADTTNATVDNVAPTTTVSTASFSNDTGSSSTDFITSTAAQTISGTLSANLQTGETVQVSLDNGSTWANASAAVGQNTWSLSGQTLSASNTLRVRLQDAAGNTGTASSQAYTLDTSAPAATSTPNMTAGTDSGTSNSDDLTSNTTPTFTGTAEAGSTVTLYDTDGSTVLGTATATGGNWSISSSALSEGSHTVTAKATDAAGNVSSASSGLSVAIDTSAPTSTALNTTTVTTSSATSTATIATLSATDTHAITYSLSVGNGTNDADNGSFTITGTSLKVGGASLTAGTYKIYVAATDAAGNAAYQAFTFTVVDAPGVSSIVRTGGAAATVAASGTSVSYTVTFDQAVTGVDTSDFSLTATGTASGSVASVTGSGTTYTVTVNTLSGDGTLRLDLNSSGTGIQNGGSVAILSGYTSGSTYTLDHTAPNAPSTPDMTTGTDSGTSSSDNITANTTPTFTGTAESGSTVTLYDTDGSTVLGTATATGGNWSVTSSALSAGSHTVTAKTTDAAGNVSSASSGLSATIDTSGPAVTSVAVPANGAYKAGNTLSFTVNTDEAVLVDTSGGTPRLSLTLGNTTVYASYASGSGTSALVFTYTVQAGDTDSDGMAVGALQTNGGTLTDTAGNAMTLTLNSVGSTTNVLVDTTAPVVNSVAVPANATYYDGQNLDFTVNLSEAVTVDATGGTPRIALTIGSTTVYASYLSGSGTDALTFRTTILSGQQDSDGIAMSGSLQLNGGTMLDAAGNSLTTTLNSVGSTAAVLVDAIAPDVTSVSASTANGGYKAGDTVDITVTFSKAVTVNTTGGMPTLVLNDGGVATYTSGSGSNTLVFSYTVGNGENTADLDYASTGALTLQGGTITDVNGSHQSAALTLATPGAANSLGANKAIVIDTTAPTITFSGLTLSADTGTSSTDFITRTASQTVSAMLSAGLGAGDVVYGSLDNGATWSDITNQVSGTTLSWSGVTLAGSDTLKLKVTDSVGNDGAATSQAYVLDTTAPTITFSNLGLSADAGNSATDFITNTAAQTISGTLSASLGAGDIVYGSLDNGATWTNITSHVSGTTLTWNGVTLSASNTLKLKVTDSAGNDGSVTSQAYVLDTSAPTITFSGITLSADTGTSSTDFITKTAAQTVGATLSAGLGAGDAVYGSLDNGATWSNITSKVSGTTLTWDGVTLTASSTLRLKVQDNAGNDGPISSQAYVFDNVAPTPATVTALSTTSTTPTLTGTATLAGGDTMTVTVGGATYDVTPSNGVWSLDLATATPTSGTLALQIGQSYTVSTAITDIAGNTGSNAGSLSLAPPPNPTPTPSPLPVSTPIVPLPPEQAPSPPPSPAPTFLSPGTQTLLSANSLDSGPGTVLGNTRPVNPPAPRSTDIGTPSTSPLTATPTLTQGGEGHFQVIVVDRAGTQADAGLVLMRGMSDQAVDGAGRTTITVPADAFASTDPNAVIQLSAQQANGRPLPNWISFNARTGQFVMQAPPGVNGELAIKVVARDAQGHEVSSVFKVRIKANRPGQTLLDAPDGHSGRASLSEQLRQASKPVRHLAKTPTTPERVS
ncbi:MAG: DUF4347 domain-containing protein [Aquabacterium sp.]|uniref:Ig-like domain-containing protein n=1 Tax=Aquabacterium sp. TaxID=1872578 RepID=UPI0025BDD9F8|nr:Ig-like domain-containing protein [Aquabacterium sp.]MBI3382830.1 DUF4347 domain-containing protein [Aquabacterium sp.]